MKNFLAPVLVFGVLALSGCAMGGGPDPANQPGSGPGPGPLAATGDISGGFHPNFGDCKSVDGTFGSTHTEVDINGKDASMTINGKLYSGTGVDLINSGKTLFFHNVKMSAPDGGSITLNGTLDCGK